MQFRWIMSRFFIWSLKMLQISCCGCLCFRLLFVISQEQIWHQCFISLICLLFQVRVSMIVLLMMLLFTCEVAYEWPHISSLPKWARCYFISLNTWKLFPSYVVMISWPNCWSILFQMYFWSKQVVTHDTSCCSFDSQFKPALQYWLEMRKNTLNMQVENVINHKLWKFSF